MIYKKTVHNFFTTLCLHTNSVEIGPTSIDLRQSQNFLNSRQMGLAMGR